MKGKPLVSFCMSTYKRPEILQKQLRNTLHQTYSNFEVIVSDNDTQASAKAVIESINDPRIFYYCNDENLGMVKSFNKSLERSKGEFIVMLADDDPVYPEMLDILVALQNKYPDYGVYAGCGDWIIDTVFANATLKDERGTNSKILKELKPDEELTVSGNKFIDLYTNGIFTHTFLLWSSCMVNRDVALTIGGMPDYGSELLTDHAFMIAACSIKGIVYVNHSLGAQSVRGDNFGYNFYELKEKYIKTPELFYKFLRERLQHLISWQENEKNIWKFIGRGWVEYSLMLYNTLKVKGESTREFFQCFHRAFDRKEMRKWKMKFYLKAYNRPLFNFLLKLKRLIKK